jgi:hypothetical protein
VGGDGSAADEEPHLQPLREHGVHGQGGRRPGCPLPAGVATTARSGRRRPDAALAGGGWRAGPGDGACGDRRPSPAAPRGRAGSPPRVLAGQPHDQVCTCWGSRWPAARQRRIGPASAHHAALPPHSLASADASRAPSTQGCGAAPSRRTTRPPAPPTGRQHATAHHSPAIRPPLNPRN